jgi:signal transduction histidine kinase
VLAAASLVVRYRRSDVDDRQRLKWFTYAATTLGTIELGDAVMSVLPPDQVSGLQLPYGVAEFVVTIGAAVAIAIAVLRHRLFDIDRIISRTTAYGALGALILAFYLGVVVGVGALVGAGSPSRLLLSILATAVVAVAFQPARVRLQRLADRLLYGRRLTPYELLARFSAQLGQGMGFGDVLSEMARVLAEGTGSRGAAVWLREGDTEVLAAGWPDGAAVTPAGATRMAPIQNHGEEFGRLVVQRPGERLSPTEERLMDELALQAGLVVHNLRLATEVRLRIEELRHSRARLVTAQDAERRRLERDLHDGAQQNLVSLRMKLGLAQALATGVPKLEELLEQLQAEAGEALASVRALSRGVYPPLLESRGLASALSARARQVGIPVTVECTGDRYAPEVEGATYFCCAEALQNLTKHARAQHASMRVWADSGALWFAVEDDGAGFLPPAAEGHQGLQNIRDRLEALGGALEVRSAPGRGTSVAGRLPLLEAPDVAEDPEAGHAAAAASGHQPGTASGIDVRPASAS